MPPPSPASLAPNGRFAPRLPACSTVRVAAPTAASDDAASAIACGKRVVRVVSSDPSSCPDVGRSGGATARGAPGVFALTGSGAGRFASGGAVRYPPGARAGRGADREGYMNLTGWAVCAAVAGAAMPSHAQQSAAAARDALFGPRATLSIQGHAFLSDRDIATIRQMPQVTQLKYYGAMAAAPEAGFAAEATTGAFGFHDLDTARRAALRGCEERRAGGAPCVIVVDVVPRGYAPGRALTLSQDASAAVRGGVLREAGGTMAASRSTGAFGVGADSASAVAACAGGGAGDCAVVID